MKVLNNIWIAISTPNEGLLSILTIPFTIIEAILTAYLLKCILNISSTTKQSIIYISIISITSLISMYTIPNPFNIFVNYVIMFFVIKLIFKITNLKILLGIVLSALIFALIGILISNPYLTLLDISSTEIETVPIYRIGYLLLIYLLLLIISITIKYRNLYLEIIEDLDKKINI